MEAEAGEGVTPLLAGPTLGMSDGGADVTVAPANVPTAGLVARLVFGPCELRLSESWLVVL